MMSAAFLLYMDFPNNIHMKCLYPLSAEINDGNLLAEQKIETNSRTHPYQLLREKKNFSK